MDFDINELIKKTKAILHYGILYQFPKCLNFVEKLIF